jgi:hypothetical protein
MRKVDDLMSHRNFVWIFFCLDRRMEWRMLLRLASILKKTIRNYLYAANHVQPKTQNSKLIIAFLLKATYLCPLVLKGNYYENIIQLAK